MPARITHITLTCNATSGETVSLQCQGQTFLHSQSMLVNDPKNIPINIVFSPIAQVTLTIAEPGFPNTNLAMNVPESPIPTVHTGNFDVFPAAYRVDCHVAQP